MRVQRRKPNDGPTPRVSPVAETVSLGLCEIMDRIGVVTRQEEGVK